MTLFYEAIGLVHATHVNNALPCVMRRPEGRAAGLPRDRQAERSLATFPEVMQPDQLEGLFYRTCGIPIWPRPGGCALLQGHPLVNVFSQVG